MSGLKTDEKKNQETKEKIEKRPDSGPLCATTLCQTVLPLLFVRFNKKPETIRFFGSKVPKYPVRWCMFILMHPLAAVFRFFSFFKQTLNNL